MSSPIFDSNRIASAFERWTRGVIRHRALCLAVSLGLSFIGMSALPGMKLDNSIESFLHDADPVVVELEAFRARYGRDDNILVGVRGPGIFDPDFLERLHALHGAFESELPYVEEVTSLFNARDTRGDGDTLVVGELIDEWPLDGAGIAALEARVAENPLYEDTLIGRDGRLTAITIEPLTYSTLGGAVDIDSQLAGFDDAGELDADDVAELPEVLTAAENDELMTEIRRVMAEHGRDDFEIHLGGALALTDAINRGLQVDLGVFMPLAFVVIAMALGLLFRRLSGVFVPMVVVLMSLLTTLGIVVWLGLPASVTAQILPIFLLTVGVCDAVHIVTLVYQRLGQGESRDDSIVYALGHSGLAVTMTSVTTAIGMGSFISAELQPIAQLGVATPIGVMLALVYTLLLLPALLAFLPLRASTESKSAPMPVAPGLTKWLTRVGEFSIRRREWVIGTAAVFAVVCLFGAAKLNFSHSPLEWFPTDAQVRKDFELLDTELGGVITMEILVDTGRDNGLHDPDVLRRLEAAMRWAESHPVGPIVVGKATSIVDVITEIHRALNENRPEMAVIPDDRKLVAQELILFEQSGSDDLEQIVDSRFRTARLTLRVPWVNAMLYPAFLAEMRTGLTEVLGPDVSIKSTGVIAVLAQAISAVVVSMARSYVIAFVLITPAMMLMLGSFRRGLLSMIPNVIPILFALGLMGWLEIPLDSTTVIIGAMILGISVDDTIHFMHKFQHYWSESHDTHDAVRKTLSTTGAAMFVTTFVLAAGFFTLTFGSFSNTRAMGLLAGLATLMAFVCDVVLAPALMAVVTRAPAEPSARA